MQTIFLLNAWQELFEAISNGAAAYQMWGLLVGIIIGLLFFAKPILKYLQNSNESGSNSQRDQSSLSKELSSIIYQAKEGKKKTIKEFYLLKPHFGTIYIILITNFDLVNSDIDKLTSFCENSQASIAYIYCNSTELDKILIRRARERLELKDYSTSLIYPTKINILSFTRFNTYEPLPINLFEGTLLTKLNN